MQRVLYILFLALFFSCKQEGTERILNVVNQSIDFETPGAICPNKRKAFGGVCFVSCGNGNEFCPGYTLKLPDTLNNCFLRICVDLECRKGGRNFGQFLVASIQHGAEITYWHPFDINKYSLKKDEWFHVKDSTQVYYTNNFPNNEIRIFGYDVDKKSYLDIDNLNVVIRKVY